MRRRATESLAPQPPAATTPKGTPIPEEAAERNDPTASQGRTKHRFCTSYKRIQDAYKVWYCLFYGCQVSISPYLVLHYEKCGLTPTQVGFLLALQPWVSAPAGVLWSWIADRWGQYKAVMLVTLPLSLFFKASIVQGSTFMYFVVLVAATEVVGNAVMSLADTAAYTSCKKEGDYGKLRQWGAVGWGTFSGIAGVIVHASHGVKGALLVFWSLAVPCMLLTIFLPMSPADLIKVKEEDEAKNKAPADPSPDTTTADKPMEEEIIFVHDVTLAIPVIPAVREISPELQPGAITTQLKDLPYNSDLDTSSATSSTSTPDVPLDDAQSKLSVLPSTLTTTNMLEADSLNEHETHPSAGKTKKGCHIGGTAVHVTHLTPAGDITNTSCKCDSASGISVVCEAGASPPSSSGAGGEDDDINGTESTPLLKEAESSDETLVDTGPKANIGTLLQDPRVWSFLFLVGLIGFGLGVVSSFSFLMLDELRSGSEMLMGLTLTVNCVAEVPVFQFQTALFQAVNSTFLQHLVVVFCIMSCLGWAAMPWASTPWWCLIVEFIRGAAFALEWGLGTLQGRRLTPKGMEATMQGLVQGMYYGVGGGLGSFVGGYLNNHYGYQGMFTIAAAIVGVGWIVHTVVDTILSRYYPAPCVGTEIAELAHADSLPHEGSDLTTPLLSNEV